jgi:hypothetical protein
MPDSSVDLRPIQIFLDTKSFIAPVEPRKFSGGAKDFYQGDDVAFAVHKLQMQSSLRGIADNLRRSEQPGGFVQVRQREGALAKSHRPLGTLFTEANSFKLVGAEHVGELLFQATPNSLDRLADLIEKKAELTPRLVENRKTGEIKPRPSSYRCELGGIENIRLYDKQDKLKFSADQAVTWMRQPNVIGGYIVELFRPERRGNIVPVIRMILQLMRAFEGINGGILVRPFMPTEVNTQFGEATLAISVQLVTGSTRHIVFPFSADGSLLEINETKMLEAIENITPDLAINRHDELLSLLASQPLVRNIELPPILETTPETVRGGVRCHIAPTC